MSKNSSPALIHGFIDPFAPGGVEKLIEYNRSIFGAAVMSANAGAAGAGNAAGSGNGEEGAAGSNQLDAAGTGQQGAGVGAGSDAGAGEEPLGEGGKKALEAERNTNKQLKAQLADQAAKIKKFEDAGKTAEQLQAQELKDLRDGKATDASTLASRDLTILQYQVAAAAGLDLSAAERLKGTTKEELEADAKDWIAKWGSSAGNGVVPGVGQQGQQAQDVAPGMARLRHAYEESATKK